MRILLYISALILLVSCNSNKQWNKGAIVEVNGRQLLQSEVRSVLPQGINAVDSTRLSEEYIEKWIKQQLLLEKAELNVGNDAEIRILVDEYKNQLFIENYLSLLVDHKAEITPTEEQIVAFYNDHKNDYTLPENLLKGIFVVLPLEAANKGDLLSMLKDDERDQQALQTYCLKNAAKINFFTDNWVSLNKLKMLLPELKKSDKQIFSKEIFETQDTVFQYIIKIDEYKKVGDHSPLDYIHAELEEYLLTINKVNYLQKMEKNLYDDAQRKGIIKYNE